MDEYNDFKLPKDLTFDKVMGVFKDYLAEDDQYEIVETSHGYAFMNWDSTVKVWDTPELCATPQDMVKHLLGALENYMEYNFARGVRDITKDEQTQIRAYQEEYLKKLR